MKISKKRNLLILSLLILEILLITGCTPKLSVLVTFGYQGGSKEGLQTFAHKPYRIITKSGDIKWIDDATYIRRDSRGIITHYEGIVYDVTERKQAEEKIKHLNLVLRAIRSVNQLVVKEKDRERLLKSVCNNLIETRGYHSAWIALLNESGKLETYAEAGIGKAFLPIVEMLMKGELTVCGKKALKQQEVVTIKDPASTRRAMTIRMKD